MLPRKITLAIALMTVCAASAFASVITTYTSSASFNAATSAEADTSIGFAGMAGTIFERYGSSLTVGDVTFTDSKPDLFVLRPGYYFDSFTSDYLNNNDGGTSIGINFSSPVYGFSMDYGAILNWGEASSLTETFSFAGSSESIVLPRVLAGGGQASSFIGFTSDTPFSQVTIIDPTQGLAIEDLTFAADNAQGNPVPEPASLALIGLGLLGITAMRRKSKTPG